MRRSSSLAFRQLRNLKEFLQIAIVLQNFGTLDTKHYVKGLLKQNSPKYTSCYLVQAVNEIMCPGNHIPPVGKIVKRGPPSGKRDGVIRHILGRENGNWMEKIA